MKHKQQHTKKIQWKEFLIKTRKHKSQRKYSKMLRIFSISQIFAVTLTKNRNFWKHWPKEHVSVDPKELVSGKMHLYQNIVDDP